MKSRCALKIFYVLWSLVLSKAQDAILPGISCLTWMPADGQTRVSFLHEGAAGVRSLYLTVWSRDMRLVACTVNSSPQITDRYHSLCSRSDTRSQAVSRRFNISSILLLNADCTLASSSAPKLTRRARRNETERKARRKRAWILPGTLWCGSGSTADGYEELGMFEGADRCCREHDHCLHIIPAFTVNYGVFNRNFFTVSHCECDQRFRQCLLGVNDSISNMVGYSFFNILQIPCFELRQQRRCTEMYWWGMCKVVKEAPYAVFKSPLPYNTSDVEHKYADTDSSKLQSNKGQHETQSPARGPSKTQCGLRDPPRGDTFHRRTKARGCRRHQKLYRVAPSQMAPTPRTYTTVLSVKTEILKASESGLLDKERIGKSHQIRAGLEDYYTRRGGSRPSLSSNSDPFIHSSTTPSSIPPLTQRPQLQLQQKTAITAVTKTGKSHKKVPKKSRCCIREFPVRGDTFQPHCKSCLKQETESHTKTTTNGLSIQQILYIKKTKETLRPNTLLTHRNAATFVTPITIKKRKTKAQLHEVCKPQKQVDSNLMLSNTSQDPTGSTIAQSTIAEESRKQNKTLRDVTDSQRLCESLKHLDDCKFKIPPFERKYDLQNMDSKTAYHCDCTSRLAVQIESLEQSSILPLLVVDFVSQQCFTLPKEKKCHGKKSCSKDFTKASDLHQALKKIEEKDTAGVQISGNDRKRGIPVRLYKRCLRLESSTDIMAELR